MDVSLRYTYATYAVTFFTMTPAGLSEADRFPYTLLAQRFSPAKWLSHRRW